MVSVTSFSTAASPNLYIAEVTIPLDKYCSQIEPQFTIDYTVGTSRTTGGATIVPVNVSGTITYQPKGSCITKTKIFSEDFTLGISGTDNSSIILTDTTAGGQVTDLKCCVAKGFKITSLLSVAFTA